MFLTSIFSQNNRFIKTIVICFLKVQNEWIVFKKTCLERYREGIKRIQRTYPRMSYMKDIKNVVDIVDVMDFDDEKVRQQEKKQKGNVRQENIR